MVYWDSYMEHLKYLETKLLTDFSFEIFLRTTAFMPKSDKPLFFLAYHPPTNRAIKLCLICVLNSIIFNSKCFPKKQAWDWAGFCSSTKRPLLLSGELKPEKLFSLVELRSKETTKFLRIQTKTNIDKDRAYSALLLSSTV